jgi:excisionase family DNA binding protein
MTEVTLEVQGTVQDPRRHRAAEAPQLWEISDPPSAPRTTLPSRAPLRPVPPGGESGQTAKPEPRPAPARTAARRRELVLLLSVEEAAGALGIGRSKTYELIATGELETVHIGRSLRVPVDALEDFVNRLPRAGQGTAMPIASPDAAADTEMRGGDMRRRR